MRKVFTSYMKEVGLRDPKLVVLVGDISHFALQPFAEACPGRFYNVGILEPTIVSMAAGIAASGLYPVAHTIAPFLIERSLEQIKLDFCYQNLGGTLVSVGSAFDYSGLGCSHHTYNDLGIIKGLPNTQVIFPASDIEFEELFSQTYQNQYLTYFRLPTDKHGVKFDKSQMKIGQGIRVREGSAATILAVGPMLKAAMEALPALENKLGSIEVLYYPTIKPFDTELVRASVAKTKRLLVIEEHSLVGGISQEAVFACLGVNGTKFDFISIPNEFQRGYGHLADHYNQLGLSAEGVTKRLTAMVNA